MAAVSASIPWGTSDSDLGQSGAQNVTYGVLAPGAGDVEIRFSSAALGAAPGMTMREARELLNTLWRAIEDAYVQQGYSAVWPNI